MADASGPTDERTLELAGVVDVAQAFQLHARALALSETDGDVHVSCEGAERLDLSAVQILLALRNEVARRGARLWITGQNPSVQESLRAAGLASLLGLAEEAPPG